MNKLIIKKNLDTIFSSSEKTDQKFQILKDVSPKFLHVLDNLSTDCLGLDYENLSISLDEKIRNAFADAYADELTVLERNQFWGHDFLKPKGYFYELARYYFIIADCAFYSGFCRSANSDTSWTIPNPRIVVDQELVNDFFNESDLLEITHEESYREKLNTIFSSSVDTFEKENVFSNVALFFLEELDWIEYQESKNVLLQNLEDKVQLAFTRAYSDLILGKELKRFLINDELKPYGYFYELAQYYLLIREKNKLFGEYAFSIKHYNKEAQLHELEFRANLT